MVREQILIDAQTACEALSSGDTVAIDCRSDLADVTAGRRSYERGHLPGAVFLDLDLDLAGPVQAATGRHPLPSVERISATLGQQGVGHSQAIVVYDGANGALAARAWWILRWLGHRDVRLLDGGIARWEALGLPIDRSPVNREPTIFHANPDHSLVLTTEELVANLPRIAEYRLLDARDGYRFRGEEEPIDPVAGHIPGSVNLPFARFVTAEGTWLPLVQRRTLLEEVLGGDQAVSWSVMCGSGVTACHLAISGLEAGYREPRLYVGSWSEWIRDPGRPIGSSGS